MVTFRSPFERNPLGAAIGIIVSILVLYVLFTIVGWLIGLLYRYSPLLLVAALIIDYTVVTSYVRGIKNLFERNVVYGLVATVATVAFYPFFFLYFLGAALFRKKVKEARREADIRRNGKWTDYEEVSSDTPIDIDTHFEELPPPPVTRRRDEPGYDEYFK